jgi:competence protein ComGF
MWRWAAAATIVATAGATASAQQQQSALVEVEKSMTDLAREGYEVKAAEDLSEEIPKFVLQKEDSIIICQINFSAGDEHCFELRSAGR